MVQGCSLNRSLARSSGRLLLLLLQQQAAPGAARRGDRVGTPSTIPVAPIDACRRSGKPGLARRAQPRGPQSRVRGGERGRPPRPSWEAPGAGSRSPSLCPAPATSTTPRAASRNKGRRGRTRTKRLLGPGDRSRSGSRCRRLRPPPSLPSSAHSRPARTKAGPVGLTGICLLIEDCGLIIQPVPRRRRRRRQGRRRWASRGGGGGDAGGGGTRRPCSELPEERRRAGRSPEPMRAPRRPCVTSPPLYSRRDVRTGGSQSRPGSLAARGGAQAADVTRGGRHRCEPVDEWRGVRALPCRSTRSRLEPRVRLNLDRGSGRRNPVAWSHSSVSQANGLPWHLCP